MFPAVLLIRKYVWLMFHLFLVTFYSFFWGGGAHSHNCEKRLFASSCLSVRPYAWNSLAPTGPIFMNYNLLSQMLIHAKLQIGKRGQKQLTGRRPFKEVRVCIGL